MREEIINPQNNAQRGRKIIDNNQVERQFDDFLKNLNPGLYGQLKGLNPKSYKWSFLPRANLYSYQDYY